MNKGYDHERLLSYIEDELPTEQRREFERTIAADARLARLIEQIQRDRAMLRRLPPAEPPGELMEAVEHRLERDMLFGDDEAVDEAEAETNDDVVVVSGVGAQAGMRVWSWSAVAAMLIVAATVGVAVIGQFGEDSPTRLDGPLAMCDERSEEISAEQPIVDVGQPGGEQSMASREANDKAATIATDASGAGIEANTVNEADTAAAIEVAESTEASQPAVADAVSGDTEASQMSMADESADRVAALAMRTAIVPAEPERFIGGPAPPMQATGKSPKHEAGIGRERINSPPTVTIEVTSDNLDEAVAALGRFIGRLALDVSGRGRGAELSAALEHELKSVQRPAHLSLDAIEITSPARQVKAQPAARVKQTGADLARHDEAGNGDRVAEQTYVIDLPPSKLAAMMSDRDWPHTRAATNITADKRRDDRTRVAPPPVDNAVTPAPATAGPVLKDEIKLTKTAPVIDWHQIIVGRLVALGVTPQMVAGQGVRLQVRISPTRPVQPPTPVDPPNPAPPAP